MLEQGSDPTVHSRRVSARTDAWPYLWFALTLVICLWKIGSKDLWLDEAISVNVTTSWSFFPEKVQQLSGAGWFYYAVLGVWRTLAETDGQLRVLSALFAALAVSLTYLLALRLANKTAAVLSAALLATNPVFVFHAQEVRMYTMAAALVCANGLTIALAVQRRSLAAWIVSGVLAWFIFGTHYFAILAWGTQWFAAACLWRSSANWRGAFVAAIIAVLGAIAHIAAFDIVRGTGLISYVKKPGFVDVWNIFRDFLGTAWKRALLTGAAIAIALSTALWQIRGRTEQHGQLHVAIWLAAWLFLPLILLFVISHVAAPSLNLRYMVPALPAFALLAGWAIATVRPVLLAGLLFVGVCVSQLRAVYGWYGDPPLEEWRQAAYAYREAASPDEPVVFFRWYIEAPFRRYAGFPVVPDIPVDHDEEAVVYVWYGKNGEIVPIERIDRALQEANSFWLVLAHDNLPAVDGTRTRDQLLDRLSSYELVTEAAFREVRISRYVRVSS